MIIPGILNENIEYVFLFQFFLFFNGGWIEKEFFLERWEGFINSDLEWV